MESAIQNNETTFLFRRGIIKNMNTDLRFLGMFFIIYGAITCLGIITAIIGVPYIIMGMRLRESAAHFESYLESGDEMQLNNALEKQQKYYFINKILVIVALVLFLIYLLFLFLIISFGLLNLNEIII